MPSSLKEQFSIVILNYRGFALTGRCVRSIVSTTGNHGVEIIVVNNSPEESASLRNELSGVPNLRIIEPGYNTYFVGGSDLGIRNASHELVVLVNNDGYFKDDTLIKLVSFLNSHSDYAAATGNIYSDSPGNPITYAGTAEPTILGELFRSTFFGRVFRWIGSYPAFYRRHMLMDWDRERVSGDIAVGCNAYLAIRKEDYFTVGGYDLSQRLYFSEEDFYWKAKSIGKKIRYLHDAKLFHEWGGGTKKTPSAKTLAIMLLDRYRVFSRYHGALPAFLVTLASFLGNPSMISNTFTIPLWFYRLSRENHPSSSA